MTCLSSPLRPDNSPLSTLERIRLRLNTDAYCLMPLISRSDLSSKNRLQLCTLSSLPDVFMHALREVYNAKELWIYCHSEYETDRILDAIEQKVCGFVFRRRRNMLVLTSGLSIRVYTPSGLRDGSGICGSVPNYFIMVEVPE